MKLLVASMQAALITALRAQRIDIAWCAAVQAWRRFCPHLEPDWEVMLLMRLRSEEKGKT